MIGQSANRTNVDDGSSAKVKIEMHWGVRYEERGPW